MLIQPTSTTSLGRTSTSSSRSSMMKSARRSYSSSTLDVLLGTSDHSRQGPNRMVRFSNFLVTEHEVPIVPNELCSVVFIGELELQGLRNKQLLAIRKAMANGTPIDDGEGGSESDNGLTWRGIEDMRDNRNRRASTAAHARLVLTEQKLQQREGVLDADEIRQVSKTSSRSDLKDARSMGRSDAKAAGIVKQTAVRSASDRISRMSKTLSNNSLARNLSNNSITRNLSGANLAKNFSNFKITRNLSTSSRSSRSSRRTISKDSDLRKSLGMIKAGGGSQRKKDPANLHSIAA